MIVLGTKIRTFRQLGIQNIMRVLLYRLGLKTGLHPVLRLRADVPHSPFFRLPADYPDVPIQRRWQNELLSFGWLRQPVTHSPLDWHQNQYTGVRTGTGEVPWHKIADFDTSIGDIKTIWEASRLDWVVVLAQCVRSGDTACLERLNDWLADWCEKNPPYMGPNWKCGQEASIRVMHLAMAALLLVQATRPLPGLVDLVSVHLQRIAPTISYAVAQDNNHGTSEAAALFIGGSWLVACGVSQGEKYKKMGRRWLEERVKRLILPDGSFSQYSTNYHRVLLDTLCMVEVWRQAMKLDDFSAAFRQRAIAAAQWLAAMTDPDSGDAPNLGANDGARLLPLTATDYRDFRPTVQLGMALFNSKRVYTEEGPWNEPLLWLGIPLPDDVAEMPSSICCDDGGYAVLKSSKAKLVLRYPRFHFRPSHADALHVDLWLAGENLLRDGGTYSYNTDPAWLSYFSGTASHNTVQFDERDQMPRLGRFLFGDWLKTDWVLPLQNTDDGAIFGVAYRDAFGACHKRTVLLQDAHMRVQDDISGLHKRAVLRWRLKPSNWRLDGQRLTDGKYQLSITANVPIVRCQLVEGWESRYYMDITQVPVFEAEVVESCMLVTELRW